MKNPIFAEQASQGVSDNYKFYPTHTLLDSMQKLGWEPAKTWFPKNKAMSGFQKHIIELENKNGTYQADFGGLKPRIILTNSHDRTSGLSFQAGFLRLACTNGLVVGATTGKFKITHAKNPFELVLETVESQLKVIENTLPVIGQASELKLNRAEQENLAIKAIKLRHGSNFDYDQQLVDTYLRVRRPQDAEDTLWNTFNRVQETMINGGYKSLDSNRMIRKINHLGTSNVWNSKLWSEAFEPLV